MTNEQMRRVKQAINETNALIAKELRYQVQFQKQDYLASLRSHLAKLEAITADMHFDYTTGEFKEAR